VISCFDDFCLFKYESWIDELLLLKHVWIHFINYYLCVYFFWVWIDVVVCEVWMKNEKMWVLVKYEQNDHFDENWCFDSMFVVVLNVFWCMLTNKQVWWKSFGKRGSKTEFWGEKWWVRERENPRTWFLFWRDSLGEF